MVFFCIIFSGCELVKQITVSQYSAQDGNPMDFMVQLAQEHRNTEIELVFSRRCGTVEGVHVSASFRM